jgi:hypothetical protein
MDFMTFPARYSLLQDCFQLFLCIMEVKEKVALVAWSSGIFSTFGYLGRNIESCQGCRVVAYVHINQENVRSAETDISKIGTWLTGAFRSMCPRMMWQSWPEATVTRNSQKTMAGVSRSIFLQRQLIV